MWRILSMLTSRQGRIFHGGHSEHFIPDLADLALSWVFRIQCHPAGLDLEYVSGTYQAPVSPGIRPRCGWHVDNGDEGVGIAI